MWHFCGRVNRCGNLSRCACVLSLYTFNAIHSPTRPGGVSSGCVNVIHSLKSGCGVSLGVSIVATIPISMRAFLASQCNPVHSFNDIHSPTRPGGVSSRCVNVIHSLNSGCGISVGVSIVAAIPVGVYAFLAAQCNTQLMIFIALLGLGVCPVGLFIA